MLSIQFVFWAAVLLLIYLYVGYPLLLWIWSSARHSAPGVVSRAEKTQLPSVSILVIAHNEAGRIGKRLENLLTLDYPPELLQIVLASDASTDATAALAAQYQSRGVEVVEFSEHRGKAAVLNELIPRLRGEIVVLMDVRQRIEARALLALVAGFSNTRTGVVSGELMLAAGNGEVKPGASAGEGVGFYWRYEKFIRLYENKIDSTIGATGAIYALRKNLFAVIPEETILDDVLIPMQISRKGYRVLFEPGAKAHDHFSESASAEFNRKARTIAGNFQLFHQHGWLLNPFSNRLWLQTFSHKFLRLLSPLLLVLVLALNLLLLDLLIYQVLLLLQVLLYGAALTGHLNYYARKPPQLVNIAHAFCLLNWATVIGFVRFVSRTQKVTWSKAPSVQIAELGSSEQLLHEIVNTNNSPGSQGLTSRSASMHQTAEVQSQALQINDSETRPWGAWSVLNQGNGYKVKLISVTAGERLSLQYHNYRSEHWVVVAGRARVVVGTRTRELGIMQSVHIPVGMVHRIENPFAETLMILEVQAGDKLVEDDIVRLEDDYQRVTIGRSAEA